MPLYDIRCQACEKPSTLFRKLAEYDDIPACACGGKHPRCISAPVVQTDITPFVSPKTGRVISSKAALREDLARSGCFLNESGVSRDVSRWGQESRDKAFSPIAAGIDRSISQLVATRQIES